MKSNSSVIQSWPYLILALFGTFCLAPFGILCFYAHPAADDWYMAVADRDMGTIQSTIYWYKLMSGRVVSQILTGLHPMRLGITAYQTWCLGFVLLHLAGFAAVVRRWLPGLPLVRQAAVVSLLSIVWLWCLKSPAQGFFWITAGNIYSVASILLLFLLACAAPVPGASLSWARHLTIALLSISASLSTELAMALQFVVVISFMIYGLLDSRRVHPLCFTLLIALILAALVLFLSPGVPLRMASYQNDIQRHLLPALVHSGKLALIHLILWTTAAPVFLISILALNLWPAAPMSDRRAKLLILLALVLILGTTWGGFFTGSWATGQRLPPRSVNFLSFFFVMECSLLVIAVSAFIQGRGWNKPAAGPASIVLIILALVASVKTPNNISMAWRDWLKGDAKKFHLECLHRYALIEESKTDEVTVPPLRVRPVTLFFNDLKPDVTDWRNTGMADFYHKKAIHLSE